MQQLEHAKPALAALLTEPVIAMAFQTQATAARNVILPKAQLHGQMQLTELIAEQEKYAQEDHA